MAPSPCLTTPGRRNAFATTSSGCWTPISKHQTVKLALRPLSDKIPATDELLIPKRLVEDMDAMKQGLILVCGKAGQGKSTSLASLLQHRAEKFKHHIVTLEQPIEYILQSGKSSISQREIGVSTDSFSGGLRAALRQAPDLILVGEIRDRETAEIALSAAESGHMVFGTLHTSNAAQSIERFVEYFPDRGAAIRMERAELGLARYHLPDPCP